MFVFGKHMHSTENQRMRTAWYSIQDVYGNETWPVRLVLNRSDGTRTNTLHYMTGKQQLQVYDGIDDTLSLILCLVLCNPNIHKPTISTDYRTHGSSVVPPNAYWVASRTIRGTRITGTDRYESYNLYTSWHAKYP
eukprot:284237_1